MQLTQRLQRAKLKLNQVKSPDYLQLLVGTLGADPLGPYRAAKP